MKGEKSRIFLSSLRTIRAEEFSELEGAICEEEGGPGFDCSKEEIRLEVEVINWFSISRSLAFVLLFS